MHRLHRQHRRRAAQLQLGRREPRGGCQRGFVVRRFERPDALPQPRKQRQVIGQSPEQRLAQMDVGLDEAGQHERPGGIDRRGRPCALRHAAHRRDAVTVDEQIALDDVEGIVHRDNRRVTNQHRHGSSYRTQGLAA